MKTKHLPRILVLLSFIIISSYGRGQQLHFAKAYSFLSQLTTINSLQSDDHGNHIIAGIGNVLTGMSPTIFFGTDSFANTTRAFLASLDSNGKYNWAKSVGTGNYFAYETGNPLAICDAKNRLFVCGNFSNTVLIGDSLLPYAGINSVFIARFSTDGSLLWVKIAAHQFLPFGFTEDRAGNLILTGLNRDTCTIGSTQLTSDIVLAKFDTMGTELWARSYGSSQPYYHNWPAGVSTDYNNRIYITGSYRNNISFDNINLNLDSFNQNQAEYQGFIAKFDANGQAIWAKEDGYQSYTIATDSAGNSYTGGYGGGPFDTIRHGSRSWFISKFDANGKIKTLLYDSFSSLGFTEAIVLDKQGNCYATGYVLDSFKLGPFVINGPQCHHGVFTAFLVALDPLGHILWGKGNCNSSAFGYAIDVKNCNISYAGTYITSEGPFVIDGMQVPSYTRDTTGGNGNNNIFLVSFDTCMYNSVNVGINSTSETNGINVYPNPANSSCTIDITNAGDGMNTVLLMDMEGKCCNTIGQFSGHSFTFSVVSYPPGIYLLRIKNANGEVATRKLVIM